jgi:hypothetical protein
MSRIDTFGLFAYSCVSLYFRLLQPKITTTTTAKVREERRNYNIFKKREREKN